MRDGDAEKTLLQVRRAIETANAIVSEGVAELVEKRRRKARLPGLQISQVGEEVLLGAVAAFALFFGGRLAAEEGGDVHEGLEDLPFELWVALGAGRLREPPLHCLGHDVVAQQEPASLLQGRTLGGGLQSVEADPA